MAALLIIKPLSAKLTRDTELFAKMDPYCVVRVGHQTQKTAVARKAGKLPFWKDQLVFRKKTEEEVVFEVWDSDSATADDLVGEGRLLLREIEDAVHEAWIKLTYRGRSAGKLRFSIEVRLEQRNARSEPNLEVAMPDKTSFLEEVKCSPRVIVPRFKADTRVAVSPARAAPVPPRKSAHKEPLQASMRSVSTQLEMAPAKPKSRPEAKTFDVEIQVSQDNSNLPCRIKIPSSNRMHPPIPKQRKV